MVLCDQLTTLREAFERYTVDMHYNRKVSDPLGYGYYCGYLDALYLNVGVIGSDHSPSHSNDEELMGYHLGQEDAVGDMLLRGVEIDGWDYEGKEIEKYACKLIRS